ncbi:MsnO8 family LLM class oxidoreductase [Facklamia miroungae]|uniref:Luciferase family oxidoreductase, group 1 n=1 Tax=Facklamia miroungae TaxID=120956 RepID=A0A1G7PD31_9LACT|nr:MsnO8 family LLM class oxidoreductase [Facklamia miroungae]NKZ28648.1 MsnO8 family LLM class oxidoreductase [Facklamia miroungae]SDF83539.1 luciferase family oxidoreductase, group 1 [Facklamia miroungae]
MKLGIHDLLPLNQGETTQERFAKTIQMVQALEAMGYSRYWASEHHGMASLASSTPELLLAYLAAVTNKIRLGTGGTMIVNYSPLKIAEIFKTLTLLAPDRIDFGIGRAPGTDHNGMMALSQGNPIDFDHLYDKAQIILDYLTDTTPKGFYSLTQAIPVKTRTIAQPWMLGSSGQSAVKAGQMGLGYSFAKFFGVETDPSVFKAYRDHFQASEFYHEPKVMVSYKIILADSQEEADYWARPSEISHVRKNGAPLMSFDRAQEIDLSLEEQSILEENYQRRFMLKGTPENIAPILQEEIERLGIDELMAYMPIPDQQSRLHSYKLLTQIFQ